uniref:Uncharacterized protein n=1 Tax=Calcidiscus leptoporus TaxID=127549 RepID=A0A7S0NS85_9EUKA
MPLLDEELASLSLVSDNEHAQPISSPIDESVDVVQLRGLKALELDVLRMPTEGGGVGSPPGSVDFECHGGVHDLGDWRMEGGPFRMVDGGAGGLYFSLEELTSFGEPCCQLVLDVHPHRIEASDGAAGFENTVQSGRSFMLFAKLQDSEGEPILQHPPLELRASLVFDDDHRLVDHACDSTPLTGETVAVANQGVATFRLKICINSYHHNRRRFCIFVQSAASGSGCWRSLAAFSQPLRSVARLDKQVTPQQRSLLHVDALTTSIIAIAVAVPQNHAENVVTTPSPSLASTCSSFSDETAKTDSLHELQAMQRHLQLHADERQLLRKEFGAHKEQLALLMQQQQEILREVDALRSSIVA